MDAQYHKYITSRKLIYKLHAMQIKFSAYFAELYRLIDL